MSHRFLRRVAAGGSALALLGVASLSGPVAASAGPASGAQLLACTAKRGAALTSTPWPQTRLNFRSAWSATPGGGVTVAVIDSGLDLPGSLASMHVTTGYNVLDHTTGTPDCVGHGTAVAAIIAAPESAQTPFVGVAPDATILPIKQSDGDANANGSDDLAAGIEKAISARVKIANVSVDVTSPTPALAAAVAHAHAAGLLLVCAAGNDGAGVGGNNLPAYPAAYASKYSNVVAVSAVGPSDTATQFSVTGHFVSVAAPGEDLVLPASGGGYAKMQGTSFAVPYVTGTAALMLAADHSLSAAQIRDRLEATADAPAKAVPDPQYGYGIVNPYLAVNSTGNYAVPTSSPTAQKPIAAPVLPPAPDHSLRHRALAVGISLLGLTLLAAVGAAVWRADRRHRPGRRTA